MLGPPNQGSQSADYVYSLDILRPLAPEALEQLGTGDRSIPRRLGAANFELGIIAGTESDLGTLTGASDTPSDGTVAVTETMVPGMVDFIELPVRHSFMMWRAAVRDQVLHFLLKGRFDHAAAIAQP
jgi:hypothetical protein